MTQEEIKQELPKNEILEEAAETHGDYQTDDEGVYYEFAATDPKGNKASMLIDGSVEKTKQYKGSYHVQGGAKNGGKTFTASVDSLEPGGKISSQVTISEAGREDRTSENPELADKVISQAAKAVLRNSNVESQDNK